jgi:hypothetical protein
MRDKLAEDSLEMLIEWLKEGGNVAIHGMHVLFCFTWLEANRSKMQQTVLETGGKRCADW